MDSLLVRSSTATILLAIIKTFLVGQTYFFRVIAVSSVGKSIPSFQSAYAIPGESLGWNLLLEAFI